MATKVRPATWLFLLRVVALLGLAVSVMVLIDYSSPEMAFCSSASGCGGGSGQRSRLHRAVLRSADPLPAAARRPRLRRPPGWLALRRGEGAAGRGGQSRIGQRPRGARPPGRAGVFHRAILLFVLGGRSVGAGHLRGWCGAAPERLGRGDQAGAGPRRTAPSPGSVRAPAFLDRCFSARDRGPRGVQVGRERPRSCRPAIAALHLPGLATVVEFFDYQCPHCRMAIPELDPRNRGFQIAGASHSPTACASRSRARAPSGAGPCVCSRTGPRRRGAARPDPRPRADREPVRRSTADPEAGPDGARVLFGVDSARAGRSRSTWRAFRAPASWACRRRTSARSASWGRRRTESTSKRSRRPLPVAIAMAYRRWSIWLQVVLLGAFVLWLGRVKSAVPPPSRAKPEETMPTQGDESSD